MRQKTTLFIVLLSLLPFVGTSQNFHAGQKSYPSLKYVPINVTVVAPSAPPRGGSTCAKAQFDINGDSIPDFFVSSYNSRGNVNGHFWLYTYIESNDTTMQICRSEEQDCGKLSVAGTLLDCFGMHQASTFIKYPVHWGSPHVRLSCVETVGSCYCGSGGTPDIPAERYVSFRKVQNRDTILGWLRCRAESSYLHVIDGAYIKWNASLRETPITIFPNPFDESVGFQVNLPGGITGGTLQLSDFSGRVVRQEPFEGTMLRLNRQGLQRGVYLYEVRDATGQRIDVGKIMAQ
jgi:hypothetical protein